MNFLGELTDDEDFLELVEMELNPREPRVFRERPNNFLKWRDNEFFERYRLSKPVVRYLIGKIYHEISPTSNRSSALSAEEKVFLTLRFLATGSMLRAIGDLDGVDKSTVSRAITSIIYSIARLRPEFIEMPTNEEEIAHVRQGFYNICHFPRCIGALDCTHVRIRPATGGINELYRNRKGFFPYNVQAVCDSKYIIRNLVCRWAGSSHDATIFANSRLRAMLENGEFGAESLLLGDGGYGLKNYLITPLGNPRTPAEQLFNEAQIRTRNSIEKTFGIWKQRFPVLALGIRLKREKVEPLIVATAVLHNIASHMRDRLPPADENIEAAIQLTNNVNEHVAVRGAGANENNSTRQLLIHNYFERLLQQRNL